VATEKEAQKRIQAITMDDEKKSTVVTSFIDQMKRNE
jgi:hypothetical protein